MARIFIPFHLFIYFRWNFIFFFFIYFYLFFVATDFTLKPSDCPDTELPVRIADSDRGCLWYKKDTKFKIPKGEVRVCVCVCGVCVCACVHHSAAR